MRRSPLVVVAEGEREDARGEPDGQHGQWRE